VERWARDSSSVAPEPMLAGLAQHGEALAQLGRRWFTRFLQRAIALQEAQAS